MKNGLEGEGGNGLILRDGEAVNYRLREMEGRCEDERMGKRGRDDVESPHLNS